MFAIVHNVYVILSGILTQRWKVVQGPVISNPENVEKMVAATTALHNYLCHTNDATYLPVGAVDAINGNEEVGANGYWRAGGGNVLPQGPGAGPRNHTVDAANARAAFTDYFTTVGAVDWQYDHVNRRANRL